MPGGWIAEFAPESGDHLLGNVPPDAGILCNAFH
jgi:hypothetical protein